MPTPDPSLFLDIVLANPWLIVLIVWGIIWKGIALWKAARLSHKKWFIVLLIVNSIGILEIFYIYFIARKYSVTTEEKVEEEK